MPRRIRVVTFLLVFVAPFLLRCGGGEPPPAKPSLAHSSVGCPSGNMPCTGSLDVPLLLVNGTDPATFGIPISCSVTASDQQMTFITVPSQPWFGVSPGNGTLAADATTTIQVTALNAASVSGRNVGVVTVSAAGYSDNGQMAVELNCNVPAATCKVAFSCDSKANPLP